jgi:hypothetical protein
MSKHTSNGLVRKATAEEIAEAARKDTWKDADGGGAAAAGDSAGSDDDA